MSDSEPVRSIVPLISQSPAIPIEAVSRVDKYARKAKSINTERAYKAAWQDFLLFCEGRHYQSLPAAPFAIQDYLSTLADGGQKASTLQVKLAAISLAHKDVGLPNPVDTREVKDTIAGIRRTIGIAPHQKAPATIDVIRAVVGALPQTLRGKRDKALILIGFAGAFRRSELVAICVEHLHDTGDALRILVPKSKTDQEGEGKYKNIPLLKDRSLCPTRSLRAWLREAGIISGPVFCSIDRWGHVHGALSAGEVPGIIKRAAIAAGIDPLSLSGHSLRAGFVTQAAMDGVDTWAIKEQTGHKDTRVLEGYIRAAGNGAQRAVKAVFEE